MARSQPLERAYHDLSILSLQHECETCRKCETNVGLVYLLDREPRTVSSSGVKTVSTSQGISYIARSVEGWCAAYDSKENKCTIYPNRPLCCRIYPLDLMNLDDEIWWILHTECPIAQRYEREHKLDILIALTMLLEERIPEGVFSEWLREDRHSQVVEAFLRVEYSITRLRRFRSTRVASA
jgi:Fe-S-cluster containining protein